MFEKRENSGFMTFFCHMITWSKNALMHGKHDRRSCGIYWLYIPPGIELVCCDYVPLGLQRFTAVQLHRGIYAHDAPNRSKNGWFGNRNSSIFATRGSVGATASSQIHGQQLHRGNEWTGSLGGLLIAIDIGTKTLIGVLKRCETKRQLTSFFCSEVWNVNCYY